MHESIGFYELVVEDWVCILQRFWVFRKAHEDARDGTVDNLQRKRSHHETNLKKIQDLTREFSIPIRPRKIEQLDRPWLAKQVI